MKLFAFVMAIIVIVQSCMPCTDVFAMSSGKAKVEIANGHGARGAQDDACSPFCLCACCAGFSLIFHSLPSIAPAPVVCAEYIEFYLSDIREMSLPIWQPPQFVA